MSIKKKIIKELVQVINEAEPILSFLQNKMEKDKKFPFHIEYQQWYTKALKIVEVLAPDRYNEFKNFYEIDPKRKFLGYGTYVIQDYIKGVAPSKSRYSDFDCQNEVLTCFYNQYTILSSLTARINNILNDIQTTLLSELQEDELSSAKDIMKISLRASGAICGVIIEGHLQKICKNHKITIRKKHPGISDLNELLKTNKIYETSTWRKVSYLGDIRNICSHKKETEPTKEQILELLDGTNWVIKNIY